MNNKKFKNDNYEILPYEETDKERIKEIAMQDITSLATTFHYSSQAKKNLFDEDVMPTLEHDSTNVKILRHHNTPIGFISYSIYSPFISFFENKTNKKAKIFHMAVDKMYRKKGHGSTLLKHALQDCKKQSVSKVCLWTNVQGETQNNLGSFYCKHGFRPGRHTKLGEQFYSLRLRPHPLIKILKLIRK